MREVVVEVNNSMALNVAVILNEFGRSGCIDQECLAESREEVANLAIEIDAVCHYTLFIESDASMKMEMCSPEVGKGLNSGKVST